MPHNLEKKTTFYLGFLPTLETKVSTVIMPLGNHIRQMVSTRKRKGTVLFSVLFFFSLEREKKSMGVTLISGRCARGICTDTDKCLVLNFCKVLL